MGFGRIFTLTLIVLFPPDFEDESAMYVFAFKHFQTSDQYELVPFARYCLRLGGHFNLLDSV